MIVPNTETGIYSDLEPVNNAHQAPYLDPNLASKTSLFPVPIQSRNEISIFISSFVLSSQT